MTLTVSLKEGSEVSIVLLYWTFLAGPPCSFRLSLFNVYTLADLFVVCDGLIVRGAMNAGWIYICSECQTRTWECDRPPINTVTVRSGPTTVCKIGPLGGEGLYILTKTNLYGNWNVDTFVVKVEGIGIPVKKIGR